MKWRNPAFAIATGIAVAALIATPPFEWARGLSVDSAFWLRHQIFGSPSLPSDSPVVVVAIDEETYRTEPFSRIPKVMWTKQIANTLDGLVAGGAKVVGFDVVFSTSVETHIPNFDREFRVALRKASRPKKKVVLAKVLHETRPVRPYPGYSFAVGRGKNIRAANVITDEDGVIRRMPLWFPIKNSRGQSRQEPSLALEIAGRGLGEKPKINEKGDVNLNGYRVPRSPGGGFLMNFNSGDAPIPTYSLADLNACQEAGREEYFREHFAGKIVLFGAVLDVEDRKLTSQRFVTPREGEGLPKRCILPVMRDLYYSGDRRDTIPGVYVHATAVRNLVTKSAVEEAGFGARITVELCLAALAGLATLLLSPLIAAAVLSVGTAGWVLAATALFNDGLFFPVLDPVLGVIFTFGAVWAFRFVVADRGKRELRKAFSLYLPPQVVDRVVDSETPPELGGEVRNLTMMFTDAERFTSLSEGMSPQVLVSMLNRYLSRMTEIIEEHGGIVDKYVGDGITAIFGAPLDDPDHALHAVQAALACQKHLEELRSGTRDSPAPPLRTRFGLNSGEVLVGNIGSSKRFNYTVLGDHVNLASRLEGANKEYGATILASESTARACAGKISFRELDRARVVGRNAPVTLYEPLGTPDEVLEPVTKRMERFEEALDLYRTRAFDKAAEIFRALAEDDPAARCFLARIEAFKTEPPPGDWDGVHNLESK